MPRSVHSMMRHGLISTKAYNSTLAKTRSQKSKMAHMDDQSKDDGRGTTGKLKAGEINAPEHQRASAAGVVRKPNATAHGGAPRTGPDHINKASNKKKFPPGGIAPGKGGIPHTPSRIKGTVVQPGPYYGGGGRKG